MFHPYVFRWWSKFICLYCCIWRCVWWLLSHWPFPVHCRNTTTPSCLEKAPRNRQPKRHGHPSHAVPMVDACSDVVVACDVCTSWSHWLQPLCDWDAWADWVGRMTARDCFILIYSITLNFKYLQTNYKRLHTRTICIVYIYIYMHTYIFIYIYPYIGRK